MSPSTKCQVMSVLIPDSWRRFHPRSKKLYSHHPRPMVMRVHQRLDRTLKRRKMVQNVAHPHRSQAFGNHARIHPPAKLHPAGAHILQRPPARSRNAVVPAHGFPLAVSSI